MGVLVCARGRVSLRLRRCLLLFFVGLFAALASPPAPAHALGTCGDVDCSGSVSASDALAVLKKAVGGSAVVACRSNCGDGLVASLPTDALVVCGDFNCSASISASDALSVLKKAVGAPIELQCGTDCPGVSTTTSTTLPPTSDEQSAVEVVNSVRAAADVYGTPTNVDNIRKLERLAAFTNRLVDSDAEGTLTSLTTTLEDLTSGKASDLDLSACVSFGSGSIDFDECGIGSGTTFDGTLGGSGNTFTLDLNYTVTTPFQTTTIDMDGSITTTTSAVTGTITIVTYVTQGTHTSTTTVTVQFDVGIVNVCPTSGTVTFSYHVVEQDGATVTRDDSSGFTATYGPNCGDVTFESQTTTTLPVTTTTIGGGQSLPEQVTKIVAAMHDLLDLATGDGGDYDRIYRLALWIDDPSLLAGLHSQGLLMKVNADDAGAMLKLAGVPSNIVPGRDPDPACIARAGGTTTYTGCSINYGAITFDGTLTISGNDLTSDMHFTDGSGHKRDFSGTTTITSSSLSGSMSTISLQEGFITYDNRTTLEFNVDLASRCGVGGTMREIYDLKTLVNGNLASRAQDEFTAHFGPGCGQGTIE